MDKEQKPILKWMIDKSYRPVVFKTIAGLMLLEISKLISAVYKAEYIQPNDKTAFINDVMEKDTVKRKFLLHLIELHKREGDIVAEIMTQHDMTKNLSGEDKTFYHDLLVQVFREECSKVKKLIEESRYDLLYRGEFIKALDS